MNNILIYGPPASGKSFFGQKLANSFIGTKFFDLDEEIEERTGDSIEQIISYLGESGFRKIERDVLEDLLYVEDGAIISLGGGSLLDPETRKIAETENVVLCLNFPQKTLEQNFLADKKIRPLCKDKNTLESYRKLLSERKSHYDSFKFQITGAFVDPNSNVENGLSNLLIGPKASYVIASILRSFFRSSKVHIVYDNSVSWLFDDINEVINLFKIKNSWSRVKATESKKSLSTVEKLLKDFKQNNLNRSDVVVSIGGGITSDLVGFATSQWKRGIRWINIPTTLLSMVDASVGGKTGVNFRGIKNLIGAFHKPSFVIIDPLVLKTLSEKEFKSGFAEAYKHYLLDRELHDSINDIVMQLKRIQHSTDDQTIENSRLIGKILNTKLKIVKEDPFERSGQRESLNLGHTIAHAIEAITKNKVSHGEAVAIGLYQEQKISLQHKMLKDTKLCSQISQDLSNLGLSVEFPKSVDLQKLLKTMEYDKKNVDSSVKFVVLDKIGSTKDLYL